MISFPLNCTNEGSRWAYATKLFQMVINDHNAQGQGTTPEQEQRIISVLGTRNEQVAIARQGSYWNPKIPDHVQNGVITYPPGLNQENEGSKGSFLIGLSHKLILEGLSNGDDMRAVVAALGQAKQDAISSSKWNPSLGDIS